MKWTIKREILPIVVIIVMLALSFYFYQSLPDPVPSHFNAQGQPDSYMGKLPFILIFGGIVLVLYFLLTFIPFLDPFWNKIESKYGLLLVFRDLCMLFFTYIYILVLIAAKRGSMPVEALNIGMGLLFIFLGNWLPRLPRNFFFGIRVPWTLASDIVWKKSHIVGGWLFVAAGIILIILALTGINTPLVFAFILTPLVLVSAVIYPLIIYRRLQKEGKITSPQL